MKRVLFVYLFLLLMLSSSAARAAETLVAEKEPPPPTKFQQYIKDFDAKFDRGAINFAAGLSEIVREPLDHYRNPGSKNKFLYTAQGAGVGLFNGLADTVGGFLNAATAMFPQFEIPLPKGGIKAENITGGNAEVFPHEEVTQDMTSDDTNSDPTNY